MQNHESQTAFTISVLRLLINCTTLTFREENRLFSAISKIEFRRQIAPQKYALNIAAKISSRGEKLRKFNFKMEENGISTFVNNPSTDSNLDRAAINRICVY